MESVFIYPISYHQSHHYYRIFNDSIDYTGLRIGFVYTIVSRDGEAVIKDRHFFFLTVDAKYNHNRIPMFVLNKFY